MRPVTNIREDRSDKSGPLESQLGETPMLEYGRPVCNFGATEY